MKSWIAGIGGTAVIGTVFGMIVTATSASVATAHGRAPAVVRLQKQIYVERVIPSGSGALRVVLQPATRYSSGDRLVFVTRYRNDSTLPVRNYVVAAPVPSHVRVEAPAGSTVEVSVDGGRRWGPLQALSVAEGSRRRPARGEDVTHIRWAFAQAVAPGDTGQISYRGTVR